MSGPWESCSDTSPKTDAAKLDYHPKLDHWKYEQEWRLVLTNTAGLNNPVHHFKPTFLKEIIFGCQTTDSEKATIMEWLSFGGLKPELFEAVRSEREYKLKIVPLGKSL